MLRGVFFDLGGTLFQHLPRQATLDNLAWALETQGVGPVSESLLQGYPPLRAAVEQRFAERAFFLHQELVLEAAAAFARELQDAVPATFDAERFARTFYALQRSAVTEHLAPRDDAAHVLQTLREWGYFVAIVSNIDEDYLGPLLARVPDFAAVDLVLSSELCRSCKPDAAIFQQAFARSGVPATEVLYVGDSRTNDVLGAGRLGCRTAWLTCDQPPAEVASVRRTLADTAAGLDPAVPDLCITTLSELLDVLQPAAPNAFRR